VSVHDRRLVETGLAPIARGLSAGEVGRRLDVSRSTVRYWVRHPPLGAAVRLYRLDLLAEPEYAYLLGLYLGDGWIATCGRRAAAWW